MAPSRLTRFRISALVAAALLLAALPAAAAPQNILAEVEHLQEAVVWHPVVQDELILGVTGPCVNFDQRFRRGEEPFFRMVDDKGAPRRDGIYRWYLKRVVPVDRGLLDSLAEARAAEDGTVACVLQDEGAIPPVVEQSGYFTVSRGIPIFDDQATEKRIPGPGASRSGELAQVGGGAVSDAALGAGTEGSGNMTPIFAADQVINDDLIVDGSLCVGFDCVNGEVFSFDTIRLKENNLRIKFDDTSVAASFPRNDWQLTANESANGGASKFSIEDISGGRTPFTVEANAPSHSLYVDDGGRIGMGTSTPSVEIHVIDGDTPTLRLAQDGSSGFEPQTWDVAGNETNFFVRDVTNGSALPLRIRPTAPSNSIFINTNGNVGMGTSSPTEALHIRRTDGNNVGFAFEQTSGTDPETWFFRNNPANGAFVITDNAAGLAPFKVFDDIAVDTLVVGTAGGAQEVQVTGTLRVNGTAMTVPDFVFDPEFDLESIDEHAASMWEKRHLPAVGPGKYDKKGRASVDILGNQFGMLEELEKAHIYIEQLHQRIRELEEGRNALAELASRLEKLESTQQAN